MWPTEINPSFRGMVATADIAKGEVIGLLPFTAPVVLSFNDVEASCRIGQQLSEKYDRFDFESIERLQFMLFIMQERRNPFSEWYDWIQTLPMDWSQ